MTPSEPSSPSPTTTTRLIPSFQIDGLLSWQTTSPMALPSPNLPPPPSPSAPSPPSTSTLDTCLPFSTSNSSSFHTSSASDSSLRTLITLPSPTTSLAEDGRSTSYGDSSLSLSPTSTASNNRIWSSVGGLPTRSNSVSSNHSNSSSKTDSFFSRGLASTGPDVESLTPPKALPGSGTSLGRAGSVGRSSPGGGSRLVPGPLGGGGPRSNRSVSDAASRHTGGDLGGMRPFFAFEREAVASPIPPMFTSSSILSSLPPAPISSSVSGSGLPPASLASSHDLSSPTSTVNNLNREASRVPPATPSSTKEPQEGDELVELVLEDEEGAEGEPARKKRRRRRWKLVGLELGRGAFSCVWGARLMEDEEGVEERKALKGLVAVKMMSKELCMENSRTLTSFTREVEILKTLHHPSIIPHLTSFSTPTHHILALPFLPGGELFSIVASPELWSRVGMGWVRRVWGELEAAVGWLHSEGVVHRDVKLENVLLTVPLPSCRSGQALLPKSAFPPPPQPLINLADFGLAKRLPPPPESATLTTRCGSDSFACPEIIMGKEYDGRKADSWACGVVLFAMLTRSLPFGSPPTDDPTLEPPSLRRSRMLRIAKGEYAWPPPSSTSGTLPLPSLSAPPEGSPRLIYHGQGGEAARKVVEGLLKRDPAKRLRAGELGEVGRAWLGGEKEEEEGDWGVEET